MFVTRVDTPTELLAELRMHCMRNIGLYKAKAIGSKTQKETNANLARAAALQEFVNFIDQLHIESADKSIIWQQGS